MEKVIIYGYSSVGEAVYQECMRRKIPVLCFCEDSVIQKSKASAETNIFSLEEIKLKNLEGKFIICIPNALPVIKKLEKAGYKNWELAAGYLFKDHYIHDLFTIKSREIAIREVESCILSHHYLEKPDKLFLRTIDLEITERCSMRCRDCSNLMQFYKKPKNHSVEAVISWLEDLLKYADEIYEVRILGGEPFMHQGVHKIIEKILPFLQIHRISIFSNATIMPTKDMWDIMENSKVGFEITNYGVLSRKLSEIQGELDKRGIAYNIHEMGGWTQCSNIEKHGRSRQALKELYAECCAKNLTTLLDGKVYKCPYIANAVNLKAIPLMEGEYIDLSQLGDMELEAAKRTLKYYLYSKECFESCDYCSGRLFQSEEIEPAIQISEPRAYTVVEGEGVCRMI